MINRVTRVDFNIKDSPVQVLSTSETLVYRMGGELCFHDIELDSRKTSIHFGENKILFFRVFEQGLLEGTVVTYCEDGTLHFRNLVSGKSSKMEFLGNPKSWDFDKENDILFAYGAKKTIRAIKLDQKNEI